MPLFRSGTRARPDEVSISILGNGETARVMPPEQTKSDIEIHDLRLSTALHVAGSLADRLGTQVCVLDESGTVYFIEEQPDERPLPAK
jgi:hypothetical protein